MMARAAQVAPSTVHKVWRAFGLQPHRTETSRSSGATEPRLQSARHHVTVCCSGMWPWAKLSAAASSDTGRRNSGNSLTLSKPAFLPISISMPLWTTPQPTRPSSSGTGSQSVRDGTPISPRPRPRGLIRSSGSSPFSPTANSGAASTVPPRNWKPQSAPSSTPTTPTQSRFAGPNQPTISSPRSSVSA